MIGKTNSSIKSGPTSSGGITVQRVTEFNSTAKDRTFAVKTDTKFDDIFFGISNPSNPPANALSILTGDAVVYPVYIDKLKRMAVYPSSAQQYINNAWVKVQLGYFDSTEWKLWPMLIKYFYDGTVSGISWATSNSHATVTSSYIQLGDSSADSSGSRGTGVVCSNQAIDVTLLTTLTFVVEYIGTANATPTVGLNTTKSVTNANPNKVSINVTKTSSSTYAVNTVNVKSLTGSFYIKAYLNNANYKNGRIRIKRIYGE